MKKLMTAAIAATLALGVTACKDMSEADSASIAGSWKANVDSAEFENDNRDYVLADGVFDCRSCLPPYQVAADGEWQTIDRPGADGQMIEIVDDNTIKMATRLGEKELGNSTWTVSEDGTTLNLTFTNLSGDEPVNGASSFTRTEAGPDGSHAMSGKWTSNGIESLDDAGLVFGYTLDGDQYGSTGNGTSFTATLGGEPVAIEGNNSNVMVAVERNGENGYRETYTRDGEVLSVLELTVDGDTMSAVSTDPRDNSVVRWTATRQ